MGVENLLKKLAETQFFSPEDRLTEIVRKYQDDELELESLDLISAASKPDFDKFIKYRQTRFF